MSDAASNPRPTIAVSMGDPAGIGPEVVVKALADPALRRTARFVILGAADAMNEAARLAAIEPYWWRVRRGAGLIDTATVHDVVLLDDPDAAGITPGSLRAARREPAPARESGALSFRWVDDAISAAAGRHSEQLAADAIVTAPISKEAWAMAGHARWPGHTELLAERLNARRTRMMFFSPSLRVVLVTAHVPLMEIRNILTIGRISDTIDLGAEGCRMVGVESPRIAVCGLNPHAGEAGLLGDEEQRLIAPAIRAAVDAGIDARGPFPGDTIFRAAARGSYDLVVAMYHDQGLIPVKLTAFESAVNATIGLPTIRTSPDHGTAFDIAGLNRADPGSMRAALDLAVTMARRRAPGIPGIPGTTPR